MGKLNLEDVKKYVEENIGEFHQQRIKSLDELKLTTVLKKKNPYLFKAKNVLTSEQIVKGIVDAHISSNEETLFGDFLEGLAIFIYGVRYIVAIKSGPNWGNKSQIEKLASDFNAAKKTLRTSNSKINVIAINGCCYGRNSKSHIPKKGDYFKWCGQHFWEFISGNENLYLEIIEPLGNRAKQRNEEFSELYAQRVNVFTMEFGKDFCLPDGKINWKKLVEFNSSK
jgi:hypothetical protein